MPTQPNASEIKRCKCGGVARLYSYRRGNGSKLFTCRCLKCGEFSDYKKTEVGAVNTWNSLNSTNGK